MWFYLVQFFDIQNTILIFFILIATLLFDKTKLILDKHIKIVGLTEKLI